MGILFPILQSVSIAVSVCVDKEKEIIKYDKDGMPRSDLPPGTSWYLDGVTINQNGGLIVE